MIFLFLTIKHFFSQNKTLYKLQFLYRPVMFLQFTNSNFIISDIKLKSEYTFHFHMVNSYGITRSIDEIHKIPYNERRNLI